ncbi:MAG: methyltransferase domain-containing protein [Comamonas sp.]|nr:methyltransferase domain-containing protein [Candidatus Comamonas equi]
MNIDFEAPHLEADPWGYEQLWYERRRRQLIAALLPQPDLGHVLEIGCSIGLISALLAPRAQRLDAVDMSHTAVQLAQQRLRSFAHAQVHHGNVLDLWPSQRLDTVLLCDVGYYWQRADLQTLGKRLQAQLSDNGFVLLAHWRHPFEAVVTPTQQVHDTVIAHSQLQVQLHYADADWLVHGLSRHGRSVAQQEGLA